MREIKSTIHTFTYIKNKLKDDFKDVLSEELVEDVALWVTSLVTGLSEVLDDNDNKA